MKPDERTTVLVIGGRQLADEEEGAFRTRGLRLNACDLSDITADSAPVLFAGVKAILVAEPPGRYRELPDAIDRIATIATSEGVAIGYLPCDADAFKRASALLDKATCFRPSQNRKMWIYVQDRVEQLAEVLRRHDPGPHSGNATITQLGDDFNLP